MTGWWIALGAWVALSVPVAVLVGRTIRTADRLSRQDRGIHELTGRDSDTESPSPPRPGDSA